MLTNKKYLRKKLIFYLMLLNISFVQAQISLRFPVERTVFQRNTSNLGKIIITGNLNLEADLVEARLTPKIANQGVATDWLTVDNSIDALSFTGNIQAQGGWYILEVRSKYKNVVQESATVTQVGIGEVFIIAGQSNAQGFYNPNANPKSANDERVVVGSSIDLSWTNSNTNSMPQFNFTYLSKNFNMAPTGHSAWAWGELGDLLTARLNVPVCFFNAAYSGTSSIDWATSINGQSTLLNFLGYPNTPYQPYYNLKTAIQNTISLLGIRAIIWHQGENDYNSSESDYVNNITKVINASRNDANFNVPWMVCRASYYLNQNWPTTISAQNKIISTVSNVFEGPNTDVILPRDPADGLHLSNNSTIQGLSVFAKMLNDNINDNFLNNAKPQLATDFNEIDYSCAYMSVNALSNQNGSSYKWANGSTTNNSTFYTGNINLLTKNNAGVNIYSNNINFVATTPAGSPTIYPAISPKGCVGKSIEMLAAKDKYDIQWFNGTIAQNLWVNNSNQVSAQFRSSHGCLSKASNYIYPYFVNPPDKPIINYLSGDGLVCEGTSVGINVNNPNSFDVKWNTGSTSNNINISQNVQKPIKVTLYSNYDCPSVESDSVYYHFVTNPKAPTVSQLSPFALIAAVDTLPSNFEWFLNTNSYPNFTTKNLPVTENGSYSVRTVNKFKSPVNGRVQSCNSNISNALIYTQNMDLYGIAIYPNPIVSQQINMATNKNLKDVSYQIYNEIGQLLEHGVIGEVNSLPTTIKINDIYTSEKIYLKLIYQGALSRVYPLVFAQK